MDRVVVTKEYHGIFSMQVCAVADATDEEILDVCNRLNPAGTTNGWGTVVRKIGQTEFMDSNCPERLPIKCDNHEGRLHFLVNC